MKNTYDIKTITEKSQADFEKKLKKMISEYENRNYEVEVQYSISKDASLEIIYSALVIIYANYNGSGYRINK